MGNEQFDLFMGREYQRGAMKDAAQFIGRALGCLEISRGGGVGGEEEERGERGPGWLV